MKRLARDLAFFLVGLLVAIGITASSQSYVGASIGESRAPQLFDKAARFAFPDLAHGEGYCCNLVEVTSEREPSVKFTAGHRFANSFGIEASAAHFGKFDSSFLVTGQFSRALDRTDVQSGSCEESGRYRLFGLTLAGTYSAAWGRLAVSPKLGASAVLVDFASQSRCSFQYTDGSMGSVDRPKRSQRGVLAPMYGVELRWRLTRGLDLTFDLEVRAPIRAAESIETRELGTGTIRLTTAMVGIGVPF